MRRLGALVTIALLSAPILACGDDGGLTKEEFISQGDRICARLAEESNALETPEDLPGAADFLGEAIPLAEAARNRLDDLDPPDDGDDVKEALLAGIDGAISGAEEAREAAESGDQEAFEAALAEAEEAGDSADEEAQEYGFEECGSDEE